MVKTSRKEDASPGFPEAAALAMLFLVVLPAWLGEGTGGIFAYTLAVTVLTYVGLRRLFAKPRQ